MHRFRKSASLLVVLCMLSTAFAGLGHGMDGASEVTDPSIDDISSIPVEGGPGHFTENLGQWPGGPTFVAQTAFGRVGLDGTGVIYDLATAGGGHAVRVRFAGAGECQPVGRGDMGFASNFFLGDDPSGWVTGARSYEEVYFEEVWPGIDVRYHFAGGNIKYDVLVGELADPSLISFGLSGHEGLDVGADQVGIRASSYLTLLDRDLVAWYDDGEAADVSFRPAGAGFGFDLDKEPGRALTIDPLVLPVSTFLGGTYEDRGAAMEQDAGGNIYVAGTTVSPDFPVTEGAYSVDYVDMDLVVTKLNRNCSRVLWSTYIGGSGEEVVISMDIDDEDNVHLLGETKSISFPTTEGALQTVHGGQYNTDLYVLKLSFDGAALLYSTFVGGIYPETAGDLKVHDGRAYVTAMTESANFPYGNISAKMYGGIPFVLIMSADGTSIDTLMHWGVTRTVRPYGLHVEDGGNVTIAGMTGGWDLPTTPGAYIENGSMGRLMSFVIKCVPEENETIFATYFGYSYAYITDMAVDKRGYIYLTGTTMNLSMESMELTDGAYCTTYKGRTDAFISKMDPMGTRLVYSTLVGGNGSDYPGDLEVTDEGYAVLGGWMRDGGGYEVSPGCLDPVSGGDYEGFLVALNENGTDLVHSTFLGGRFRDYVTAVEITESDTLLLAGSTESKGFPVSEGTYQTEIGGDMDIFVSELCCLYPPSAPRNLTATGGEGNITLTWEPPLDDKGYPVTHYLVHKGTSEGEMELYHILDAGTTFTDEEVEYGVYYFYAVSAFNGRGLGPLSNVDFARSVTRPDPPVGLRGEVHHEHIRLTWDPPDFTGGLDLEGYKLYKGPSEDDLRLIATITPILLSFVDMDIVDRTTYTYMLVATNVFGESEGNPTLTMRTTGVPTPPRDLNYTYGDQFIRLTWVEPEDDFDLEVARYYVYRRTGAESARVVGVVSSPGLAYQDKTVDVGVLYRYHVVAENAKGFSPPSNTVMAMTMVRPDRPRDVEATARELFVRVTWKAPVFNGASPITGYRIYLGGSVEEAALLGNVNIAGVDEPRLVFLHEVAYDGVVRSYFVTAVNAEGESLPSGVAYTLMYQVPSRPRSVDLGWGDGEVDLNWSVPELDGGTPLLSYNVYRRTVGEDVSTKLATLPASTLRFVDDTPTNGVEYAYWVSAVNLAGEGEPSVEVTATPAGAPGAPRQVVAEGMNGSVRLSWEAPDADGGRPLLGYRVYVVSEGMPTELLAETAAGDREFVQGDLVNGVVYTYGVRAFSEVGESRLSEIAEGRPAGAPSAPRALSAVWMDGMVYVSWSSPQDDGGAPIVGYRIHREDWDAGNWTVVPAHGMMFSDYDVEHNTTYNYSLHAFNDAGSGPIARLAFTAPPEEDGSEDDPIDIWPWLIALAVLALVALAIAALRRPRRVAGGPEDVEEPLDELADEEEPLDELDDVDELFDVLDDVEGPIDVLDDVDEPKDGPETSGG